VIVNERSRIRLKKEAYCNECEIFPEALDLEEYCNNPNCQFIEGIDEIEK